MKMKILGFDGTQGVGKTSGKAYSIGNLHTEAELAPAFGEGGISKGSMGTTYPCPLPLVQKIAHLQPPFMAEVDIRPVMRFGKREEQIFDITPVSVTKAAA